MTQKQITALRKFFRISTAAMVFADEVGKLHNGPGLDEKGLAMLALHKQALAELEKENPDADTVERLLEKMENTAAQAVSKFPPGGIVSAPQIPALKNAVNRQARIDELIYLARKVGKTESEISECLNDTSTPLSVEQRLNELIG